MTKKPNLSIGRRMVPQKDYKAEQAVEEPAPKVVPGRKKDRRKYS